MILDINITDVFISIIQFTIPALIVFAVTYTTQHKFLEDDLKRKKLELKEKLSDSLTPVKLQAYERITLLLDRMKPDNLVLRLAEPTMNAAQFKQTLVMAVNEEFNHNVSQQIYISDQAWTLIKAVKENTLNIINNSFSEMDPDSKATDLGKAIIKGVVERNDNTTEQAISFIKREIDIVF